MRVVLDTNVLVAAAGSSTGASAWLLTQADQGKVSPLATTALLLEYEDVLSRPKTELITGRSAQDLRRIFVTLAALTEPVHIRWRYRPLLGDPSDEMVLEAALNGLAPYIVTHNVRDFVGASAFGISVITPGDFARRFRA
jgi:putative PIN family toxin of toxin-antitoxin system